MTRHEREQALYLCAPVNALVEGLYEENIPFSDIKMHGDFGIGTFNDLDGEMVMLDGIVYQIKGDGSVAVIGDDGLTPFACVTFYRPLSHDRIDAAMNYSDFTGMLHHLLPSPNIFYALRVEGRFSHVRTRSVPRQENYRPLVEVTKEQPTFEFHDIEGTLAGFFTPSFMASLNVPGLHLHFLSKDRRQGGHLLECSPQSGRIGVQFLRSLELALPMSLDYLTTDLNRDIKQDLRKAER